MKVDCFVPCVAKDEVKLDACLRSMAENLEECGDIYVSMPDSSKFKDYEIDGHKVMFKDDLEVLPIARLLSVCRFRPNWIFQQLLKMLQQQTQTPYWFVFDADCILLKKTSLFQNGKPKLLLQPNPNDEAAFHRFIAKASGGELCPWTESQKVQTTYIADMGLFSREWMDAMVKRYFPSAADFMSFTVLNTYWRMDDTYHSIFISEYEMYGLYLEKFCQSQTVKTAMKKKQIDRWQDYQEEPAKFTREEVDAECRKAVEEGYEILKLQTNCPRPPTNYKLTGANT